MKPSNQITQVIMVLIPTVKLEDVRGSLSYSLLLRLAKETFLFGKDSHD
jgi:hypothetical protein